jgi:hypothetical protein
MQKRNSARRFVSLGVALIALVALTVSLGTGAASAGPGHAVAAKKKCKKKKHRSAAAAKKKKCKKKHAAPAPVPPAAPLTRSSGTIASITWDTDDEVDLHVFDASGNHDYYNTDNSTIPDAVENDQDNPGGPETFVDLQSPSTRTFTYYVCLYDYENDLQTSGPVHVTADITDPGGAHRSIPITLDGVDDEAFVAVSPPTATAFPASDFCHVGPM